MKTKLIFSTEKKDFEYWTKLSFIPRKKEWFNVQDFLNPEKLNEIKETTFCWSGEKGIVQSVEYRHNKKQFYVEVYIWCED